MHPHLVPHRKLGQPCDVDNACDPNPLLKLTCDPSSARCVAPAEIGKSCAARPCAAGLSCHPGYEVCYPVPRQFGMPCSTEEGLQCAPIASTGEPLFCDMLATKKCVKPQASALHRVHTCLGPPLCCDACNAHAA